MIKRCTTPSCSNRCRNKRKVCHKCATRKYRNENPLMSYYHKIKWSATKRNIEFKLSHEDFIEFDKRTAYVALKLSGADVTMDRIREGEPYQADNIQLLFRVANTLKYHEFKKQQVSIEHQAEAIGVELFYSGNPI